MVVTVPTRVKKRRSVGAEVQEEVARRCCIVHVVVAAVYLSDDSACAESSSDLPSRNGSLGGIGLEAPFERTCTVVLLFEMDVLRYRYHFVTFEEVYLITIHQHKW